VLYLVDAARLLGPRQLLVVEAGRARLAPVFSAYPFTLAGRALTFAPILRPDRGAFLASWTRTWVPPAALRATLDGLAALRRPLLPARLLAVWAFLLLFAGGPVLSAWLGDDPAVLCIAALLYPTVFAAIATLCWRRRRWGLTRAQVAMLSVEILVCPAFLPNLVRKITGVRSLDVDGAQVVLAAADDAVKAEFLGRLATRTEELIDAAADDAPDQAALRAYLAGVRAG
jgi:hypothetical protein